MATTKWYQAEEAEDEEEEALSLCDLPVTLISHEKDQPRKKEDDDHDHDPRVNETQEEFHFRSWGGLFPKEPEMCVADEVFFQGQILPLRLSFSSEAGLLTTGFPRHGKQFKFNRCKSRSESLDHGSFSEFRSSSSSRSSSLRSQNSSASTSSTTATTPVISKPRVRNQFHTHPSPKPQLRSSGPRQASFGNQIQGRKSTSVWEIFRLGVVPAPEIGLQDLKVRSTTNSANKNPVSRNSSSSSSSTSNSNNTAKSGKMSNKSSNKTPPHQSDKRNHHVFKQFVAKGGGLLSGCDCSIETVQSDLVMMKGCSGGAKSANKTESTTHAMKEKVVELKKQKQRQKQQGKKVMSRRRTFEWLKELHASHPDEEEALLSKHP